MSTEKPAIVARPRAAGSSAALWWIGGLLCLIAAGLLLAVVLIWKNRQQEGKDGRETTVPNVVQLTPDQSSRSGWTSASRGAAISVNQVAVDVDYVEYGEVRARDANNRVIVSDTKSYLQIYLNIKGLSPRPIPYTSWYGNTFDADGQQIAATLVDDQGRSFAMREFRGVSGVRGHTAEAVLVHQETVRDVVIFDVPSSGRRSIRYFRLELPAAAYGGSGCYRFEIPMSTVHGF